MAYVPLEKIVGNAEGSLYKLVILASKRALELSEGLPKLIESNSHTKTTTVALMEIAEGKVKLKKGN